MSQDVAVFLDLDNLVIGARQANLTFNVERILEHIKELTRGRIVLRRAYGDWRQSRDQLKALTSAGFITQSTVPLNNFSKNLADMQIVVDAMDTLVDGHEYGTYVLMTGDRDFTPLVQALRQRGRQVIGVGVRHTASQSFVGLCDRYVYYEELLPTPALGEDDVKALLAQALGQLVQEHKRVRASLLKQRMDELSQGAFASSSHAEPTFTGFLARFPHVVEVHQEDTTTYVRQPPAQVAARPLHLRYRSALKKRKLRVVPARTRFIVLRDLRAHLQQDADWQWRPLIDALAQRYQARGHTDISKNMINAVLLLARQADVIRTHKGQSLSTAPVELALQGPRAFQQSILRCDRVYMREILALPEPFDLEEAALALYDTRQHAGYLRTLQRQLAAPDGADGDAPAGPVA